MPDPPPAPQLAQPAAPSIEAPQTYLAYYQNPAHDDYSGNYAPVMQLFATTTNAKPANVQANLRTCIFQTGERQIHTYLMLNQTVGQTSWITLIHCPNQYVSLMGINEPSRHLGLLGDIRH